jgi:hypothetical protein
MNSRPGRPLAIWTRFRVEPECSRDARFHRTGAEYGNVEGIALRC